VQTSSCIFAAEKLAEAIFEPKKILHKRSAEAFFRGKNRWEPIFLLQHEKFELAPKLILKFHIEICNKLLYSLL